MSLPAKVIVAEHTTTGGTKGLEIQGTDFDDTINGSGLDEIFMTRGGSDFVNGKGGVDLIRYDRNGVDFVNVDLSAETATGEWNGVAFTDTLKNIEDINGSRTGNDTLTGDGADNKIQGRGGNDTISGKGGADSLFGGDGSDVLDGGNGNDYLDAGGNQNYDQIFGSNGNDTITYANSYANSFHELNYSNLSRKIIFDLDFDLNTLTVDKGVNGTDTVIDVANPLADGWVSFNGGMGFYGTTKGDTFNILGGDDNWMQIHGGKGKDTFNITQGTGTVRMNFSWDGIESATQGLVINLGTGVVKNDGYGFRDTIIHTTTGGTKGLEIRGTNFNDTINGSGLDEVFIVDGGDDYVNGKGGFDVIRYDRTGVDFVNVDLSAETATGEWNGVAFTDTLKNIEEIRGSRTGNDTLTGDDADNKILGRGGNDTLDGKGGADRLFGEDGDDQIRGRSGNDTLYGGNGEDELDGGNGDDTLNGGAGDDELFGGLGADTLTGGSGADIFDFDTEPAGSTDHVTDFEDGIDMLAIVGAVFGDLTIEVVSGNTEVSWGSGNVIVLDGITSGIGESDFEFF